MVDKIDYVIDADGRFVFTKKYHLDRGYCCGNGCINCPYGGITGSVKVKNNK